MDLSLMKFQIVSIGTQILRRSEVMSESGNSEEHESLRSNERAPATDRENSAEDERPHGNWGKYFEREYYVAKKERSTKFFPPADVLSNGISNALKVFVAFSTFLAGFLFASVTSFGLAQAGYSMSKLGHFISTANAAVCVLIATALWNGITALGADWITEGIKKVEDAFKDLKEKEHYITCVDLTFYGRIYLFVSLCVGILLVMAGAGLFLTSLAQAADIQHNFIASTNISVCSKASELDDDFDCDQFSSVYAEIIIIPAVFMLSAIFFVVVCCFCPSYELMLEENDEISGLRLANMRPAKSQSPTFKLCDRRCKKLSRY